MTTAHALAVQEAGGYDLITYVADTVIGNVYGSAAVEAGTGPYAVQVQYAPPWVRVDLLNAAGAIIAGRTIRDGRVGGGGESTPQPMTGVMTVECGDDDVVVVLPRDLVARVAAGTYYAPDDVIIRTSFNTALGR